ncbi:Haloacid dehalogenase type II [Paramagnetospirillum magnetotacticum MS-1]|uniref:(S)-2-haloacid dehalogenase n=1 Tax=Paramagnetospirillum magnetotacticum MS-1 TaxID=272627 RepID=A0A0C2YV04_PARME|nr:haloacid dehalogenase type II [Paramagnetospirillum magnetotacticum]KIL98953.1 Haloacid dehalogenase type II [Paramagnetospirillum magnetotacticum MS-1]
MTLAPVRVCVFDAYGTLFDLNGLSRLVRDDLGERADTLLRLWRKRQMELSWLPLRPGVHADFWRLTDEALDFAMDTLGLDDRGLRLRLMEGWLNPELYPDTEGALDRLREMGYPMAILSNGSLAMLKSTLVMPGIRNTVDAVLSAQSVGRFKPDPLVYQLATTHFGLAPESVCYVSANAWDVSGASAFGFQVVWINRDKVPAEKLPLGTKATVASLAELPAILGG